MIDITQPQAEKYVVTDTVTGQIVDTHATRRVAEETAANHTASTGNETTMSQPTLRFERVGDVAPPARNDVADIRDYGAVAGDPAHDCAPAINAAIADQIAHRFEISHVYIPPGQYHISTPIVIDCSGKKPRLRIIGAGQSQSVIRSTDAVPSPMISTINEDSSSQQFIRDGYIGGFSVIGTSPSGKQPDECIALTMQHTTVEELSVTGGEVAGLTLRYCITSSFRDCRFVGSNTFGMRMIDPVMNQITFDRCTFLQNDVAGLYVAKKTYGLNFSGCGFERNGVFGAYIVEAIGLSMNGTYLEGNGLKASHQIETRAGRPIDMPPISGDICLAGRPNYISHDALPIDSSGHGCDGVSLRGSAGSPHVEGYAAVILLDSINHDLQRPGGYGKEGWLISYDAN